MSDKQKKVTGIECKFVTYMEHQGVDNNSDDMCLIKERIHYDDDTTSINVKPIFNFQRSFYVTKPAFRKDHKQKKESEDLKKVQEFKTNDRLMMKKASRALGTGFNARNLKQLARSPYLYGTDVTSPVIIKKKYMDKWPTAESANKVAVLDIESSVTSPNKEILSLAVTCGSDCFLAVTKDFVKDMRDPEQEIQGAMHKYLGEHFKNRKIDLRLEIVDTPAQCVIKAMSWLHVLKPDYVTCWNIDFDANKMIDALEKEKYNPADVFSDPCVPPEFRTYRYVKAPDIKVMASGRSLPVPFQERLNMLYSCSSWQWMDSMVLYALIRKAKGQLPKYTLDYILQLELGERKLKFKEAEGLEGEAWHRFMQTKYKAEYLAYNIFDCIGVELLDERTKDIALTLNGLIGFSELRNFTSTPTQLADDLHFVYLEEFKEVIASKSDRMEEEEDKHVISMNRHIVTLATHLNVENGIRIFKDFPRLRTLIRRYVADLDVKSAYPYAQMIENISKSTTRREIAKIAGVTDVERRRIGYNITGGRVNAVEYCTTVNKVPELINLGSYLGYKDPINELLESCETIESFAQAA